MVRTTPNTLELPKNRGSFKATPVENPLTLGGGECHKACTGRTSRNPQRLTGVPWQLVGMARSGAGVTFLVNESREVMNVRQASQYLGISPDTLYRYITEGEIPAFKLGNRWKLRKTILDRWMERKMSQAHTRRR